MPQLTSLRLLFSNYPPIFSPIKPHLPPFPPKPTGFQPLRNFALSLVIPSPYASSTSRPRATRPQPPPPPLTIKGSRSKSSSAGEAAKKESEGLSMEGTGSVGFNRKRAEGRDCSDRPKTLHKKVRMLNPTNTICYVQVLGTGMDTQDTSPSVLLFFDKQRYLFNAGEGLQRFFTEHKIKLSKIDHIFLSRVCSETAGGLPGLLLTLAGMGEESGLSVNIEGPSDLKFLVNAMKSFIPNAAMVHTKSFGPSTNNAGIAAAEPKECSEPIKLVENQVVKISAILLQPRYSDSEITTPSGSETVMNGKPGSAGKPGDLSVIYACELPEIQGKFDPIKAKELGLRPGPKYGQLQKNQSVKSDLLGVMVHPSDVMGPPIPGPIVLIVDCPTTFHLQNLLTNNALSTYYADFSGNPSGYKRAANCIIHLSPSSVASTPDYQRWMMRFGSAQHIMAGHEAKNLQIPILKSSARIAARLNYLCPQFFPAPGFWPVPCMDSLAHNNTSSEGPECISAENLLKFKLRPCSSLGLDRANIPSITSHKEVIDELLSEIPEIVNAAQQIRQSWDNSVHTDGNANNNSLMMEEPCLNDSTLPSCLDNIKREDTEIVLLGTGSSQPSKYRNVTSIYINLFSKGSLLFDCGEGTLGQLKRRFGLEGADNAVRSLRFIWISHIHADHHSGLARILALRRDLLAGVPHEPLLVVGPWQLKGFLDAYQKLEDLDMQFLDCRHTTQAAWVAFENSLGMTDAEEVRVKRNHDVHTTTLFAAGSPMQSYFKRPSTPADHSVAFPSLKKLKAMLDEAGLESLISFPVVHCPHAFGVTLQAAERTNRVGKVIPGWKIVYSGDTRPCSELIEASRGATILIHEATFEDGMVDEAIAKNHSTTKEAIEVGISGGVYRTILTHFSQRYPKIPVFDETHMHNTCIGFDLMSINMADLLILPKILPHLKLLFKNEMLVEDSCDVVEAIAAAVS
ncbi:tRNAse Z trz4, mitochondrial [Dionaea muscipula]